MFEYACKPEYANCPTIFATGGTDGLGVTYLDMYTGMPLWACLLFVLAFALAFVSIVLFNWDTDNRPASTEYALDTDLLRDLWNMSGYGIFDAPTAPIDIVRPAVVGLPEQANGLPERTLV